MAADAALHFTGEAEPARFLPEDPLPLRARVARDQRVAVRKAFSGPLELRRRLGSFDAKTIADMDPAKLEEVFREQPALHRFPGSMAGRGQELCAGLGEDYAGASGPRPNPAPT